jgi:hypothetical protein
VSGNSVMTTSRHKKAGGFLVLLAASVFAALALTGVQLVSVTSRDLPATATETHFLQSHWPLVLVFIMLIGGIGLMIFPRCENAA